MPVNSMDSGGLSSSMTLVFKRKFICSLSDGMDRSTLRALTRVMLSSRRSTKVKLPFLMWALRKRAGSSLSVNSSFSFDGASFGDVSRISLIFVFPDLSLVRVTSIPMMVRSSISILPPSRDSQETMSFSSLRSRKGVWSFSLILNPDNEIPFPQENENLLID